MNILQVLILGVVEGLTEFLPISSTFHLILTSRLLALESSNFLKLFEVVIQSGAVIALLFIYFQTLIRDRKLIVNIIYSFIPTAVVGFVLHKIIKDVFFESDWLMLSVFVGMGVIFLVLESRITNLVKKCQDVTTKDALLIGLAQATSVIPGVSRSGSIIVIMMLLGYKRTEAAKYTFLLSLPTIFSATMVDLIQNRELLFSTGNGWSLIILGTVVSLISGYIVVKWFISYLGTHTLRVFGWYRLVLGGILGLFKVLP